MLFFPLGIKTTPLFGFPPPSLPLRAVLSPQTVVGLFYQTVARKTIISQIYGQQQSAAPTTALLHWPHMVSNVVHLLAQLLYPSFTVTRLPAQHLIVLLDRLQGLPYILGYALTLSAILSFSSMLEGLNWVAVVIQSMYLSIKAVH